MKIEKGIQTIFNNLKARIDELNKDNQELRDRCNTLTTDLAQMRLREHVARAELGKLKVAENNRRQAYRGDEKLSQVGR